MTEDEDEKIIRRAHAEAEWEQKIEDERLAEEEMLQKEEEADRSNAALAHESEHWIRDYDRRASRGK